MKINVGLTVNAGLWSFRVWISRAIPVLWLRPVDRRWRTLSLSSWARFAQYALNLRANAVKFALYFG
jgi:hypothetical protein